MAKMKCDQCNLLSIQGVVTHEIGCPNARKKWDGEEERWISMVKCFECGETHREDEECNCLFDDFGPDLDDEDEEE